MTKNILDNVNPKKVLGYDENTFRPRPQYIYDRQFASNLKYIRTIDPKTGKPICRLYDLLKCEYVDEKRDSNRVNDGRKRDLNTVDGEDR